MEPTVWPGVRVERVSLRSNIDARLVTPPDGSRALRAVAGAAAIRRHVHARREAPERNVRRVRSHHGGLQLLEVQRLSAAARKRKSESAAPRAADPFATA